MISNLKITDGDLVIVHLNAKAGQTNDKYTARIRDSILGWAKKKGIVNIDVLMSVGDFDMNITTMSVNDVFEEQVLKGD